MAFGRSKDEAVEEHAIRLNPVDRPRWEYKVLRVREGRQEGLSGVSSMERELNQHGRNGWELVAIHAERAVLKRLAG